MDIKLNINTEEFAETIRNIVKEEIQLALSDSKIKDNTYKSNIQTRIIKIIAEQLQSFEDDIQMQDELVNDLGADSLDIVELLMALEEEFDIKIADEEYEEIIRLQPKIENIVDFISERVNK